MVSGRGPLQDRYSSPEHVLVVQVHCKTDIPVADASYKRSTTEKTLQTDNIVSRNKFNSFAQNSYDFDQLEQNILSN